MNITLYGAASPTIDNVYVEKVYELGKTMAERGHTLVFGAGSSGLMGAAAEGVSANGGHIIGVTPRFIHEFEPIYTHCTELINTKTMAERKTIMEEKADGFIIVPGGIGTFDEFFQILTLKTLKRMDKPIVLYNIQNYWDNMIAVLGTAMFRGFVSTECVTAFTVAESAESVIASLEEYPKHH